MSKSIIPNDLVTLQVPQAQKTNGNGNSTFLESLLKTDAGNATRFLEQHGPNVRFCHDFKKWLVWRDGIWQIDRTQQVFRLGELTVRSMYHVAGDTEDPKERKALASWAIRCETET